MKILHSADWHLGARLYGQSREAEHRQFLRWLLDFINKEAIDGLIIAGDVFDSQNPSLAAQSLYYEFLGQLVHSPCRQTLIIGGNHDNPSFLNLPAGLLQALAIEVVASEPRLLTFKDRNQRAAAIVAAVPYLRERQLRTISLEESPEAAERDLVEKIIACYADLGRRAEALRAGRPLPIIGTGHLFCAGATVAEDEPVRDLYVGKLGLVPAAAFPRCFDYVALGHIHRPQRLTAPMPVHYCGAPLPLSFSEAEQAKQLMLLEIDGPQLTVTPREIPNFQPLQVIKGDGASLKEQITALAGENLWLEAHFSGAGFAGPLHRELQELLRGQPAQLLRLVLPPQTVDKLSWQEVPDLHSLRPEQVFELRLARENLSEEEKEEMRRCFRELLGEIDQS